VNQLTLYDYLSFVVPGSVVIAAFTLGYAGWPWARPDAASLVLLTAAAFVVGYAIAAIANLVEPMFLGSWPATTPNPLWGTLVGPTGMQPNEQSLYRTTMHKRYGEDIDDAACYRRGLAELRQKDLVPMLPIINQHLGFARGMAVASAVSTIALLVCAAMHRHHLALAFWLPAGIVLTVLFVLRFRRFWRWFGESVLRSIAELERT
jgi:hypothetical protein